jgi:pyruvate/2-oxoglutarate dehydrogenase complex dihydrolipoamide acyltransferase (E2) component
MREPGNLKYQEIPPSRIATFDVYSVGRRKNHVSALLEFDVTASRSKLKAMRRNGHRISFNACMLKAISKALEKHPEAAGYLIGRKKLLTFRDINISFLIEKKIHDKKVPIPLLLKKTNEKSAVEITREIDHAIQHTLNDDEIVVGERPRAYERIYYRLPGIVRRGIWRFMIRHPKIAYGKMGNVAVTSLGMMGKINGWFIHRSVHPISIGIGAIIEKPVIVNHEITIREILNMTILLDHDVIDGAPMVRFVNDLTNFIENGYDV